MLRRTGREEEGFEHATGRWESGVRGATLRDRYKLRYESEDGRRGCRMGGHTSHRVKVRRSVCGGLARPPRSPPNWSSSGASAAA